MLIPFKNYIKLDFRLLIIKKTESRILFILAHYVRKLFCVIRFILNFVQLELKCFPNLDNSMIISLGVKFRGAFDLAPGLGNGLDPVDSGGTTALTNIVANNPRIRIGMAPLSPGNEMIGTISQTSGVKAMLEYAEEKYIEIVSGASGVSLIGNPLFKGESGLDWVLILVWLSGFVEEAFPFDIHLKNS